MAEMRTILRERVDDLPLFLGQLARMGGHALLDAPFPTHGTGVGLSRGWVTVRWLPPLRSPADQRLTHVEPGAEKCLHPRRSGTGQRRHSAGPQRRAPGGRAGGQR
jgi:hypothetical protein